MADNFRITPTVDLIGRRDKDTRVISERVNLSTSPSNDQNIDGAQFINIYVDFEGDIGDVVTLDIRTSPDGVNFYPLSTVEDSSTAPTVIRNRTFTFTATSAEDEFQLPLNTQDKIVRVTMTGTGSVYASLKQIT